MADPDFELIALKRQLVWDMVQHHDLISPENQKKFGLNPASSEVMAAEHRASHFRFAQVLPLYDRIKTLSGIAALVVKPIMLELLDEFLDDEERDARLGVLFSIATSAVVADLIDKGLVACNVRERY
jgi:hypothetical protein